MLHEELNALPARHRDPLVLCYLQGLSQDAAAAELKLPKGTLKGRLERGRALLRARLLRRGLGTSAVLALAAWPAADASAHVPPLLALATAKAAVSLACRDTTGQVIAAKAAFLTQGILQTMNITKRNLGLAFLLVVSLVSGAGIVAYRAWPALPREGVSGLAQAAEADEPKEPAFLVRGREVAAIPAKKRAKFAALQQGGKSLLTITGAGEVVSWNLETRKASAARQLPGKKVIGLSADGTLGVTADGRAVTVAETATGRVLATLETAGPPPGAAERWTALERDGKIATPGAKWTPDAWNPSFAALAPDNRTLATKCGSYLEVWSLEDGKAQRVASIEQPFDRPDAPIITFAFSPDGKRVAIAGYDGLGIWDLSAQKRMFYHPIKLEQDDKHASIAQIEDVAFTPDGRTVVAAGSCHYSWGNVLRQQRKTARTCWLRAWNVATGAEMYTREYVANKETEAHFKTVALSADGSVLAAGIADGRVKLLAPLTGYEVGAFQADARGDSTISLSKNAGTLIVLAKNIRLFELQKGLPLAGTPPEPIDGWNPPWKAVAPDAPPAAAEKPSPAAQEYQALLKERDAYWDRVEKEAAKLKGDEAIRQLGQKYRLQPQVFARRFLELAKKYPQTPEAVDALWEAYTMISHGPEAEEAVAILAARYMLQEKTVGMFERIPAGPQPRAGRELLRAYSEHGTTEQIRAQAAFKLAKSLAAAAEMAECLRADTSGVVSRQFEENHPLGDDLVKAFRAEDSKQLREEAKKRFQEIAAKYPSTPHPYMKGSLGEAVAWELEELRNPALAIGKPAPEIEGKDIQDKRFKLSDYRGKVVLLTFSGNWCGPCRAQYPHERALVERLKGKRFAALSVNTDPEKKTLEESIRKGEITWRCWWDRSGGDIGPISKSWHIEGFPAIFVLDAKGVIRFKGVRGRALDSAIDSLLKEQEETNSDN